jgi:hypothetical protein
MKNPEIDEREAVVHELHGELNANPAGRPDVPPTDESELRRNECGGCTMCCKLVGVAEIDKPEGKWCPHCALGKGCKIYDTRPPTCEGWDCMWLLGVFGARPDLRPDKCKVVVGYDRDFLVVWQDAAPPKSGRQFVEMLMATSQPMVIKRLGQPGFTLANTTLRQALDAGVVTVDPERAEYAAEALRQEEKTSGQSPACE